MKNILRNKYKFPDEIIERYFVPSWWEPELGESYIAYEAINLMGATYEGVFHEGGEPTGSLVNLARVLSQVILQYVPVNTHLTFYTPGIPETVVQDVMDNARVELLNEKGDNQASSRELLWDRMNDSHEELIDRCLHLVY